MRLTILQQDLLPPLSAVSRSSGIKSTLPVLANVLIQAQGNKLKLSATNLEIGVIKEFKAEVEEEGEVTIPAKTLLELISSLPNEKINLESNETQLKITTKHFNATINGIPASEFPAIPLASEQAVTIKAKILKESLPQITFAAAADEGRPILTGILTEIKNNFLEFVSTDGFRLAHKTAKLSGSDNVNFRSLIPRKTFEEVVRLISEELKDEDVDIEISTSENQNQMIFKIGKTQLSSRLIEGQFPAWEKIVPQKFENKTLLERLDLLKAVKLASVFAKSEANVIKLEVADSKMKLFSQAKELGTQQSDLDIKSEGEKITIAFNSRFLQEALSACSSNEIEINFSGNLSPAIIKPLEEEGLEYVIMPIRLS